MSDRIDLLIEMQEKQDQQLEKLHDKFDEFKTETVDRVSRVEEKAKNNQGMIHRLLAAVVAVVTGLLVSLFKAF
jgi:hypothetical protein